MASWLAPRLQRAATGSEDRMCLSESLSGWFVTPDLTGDAARDVIATTLAGCTPRITMRMTLLDGRTGRIGWHTSVTSFLPLPFLTAVGSPARPGVLVESYDWSWQVARQHGRTYHGTALTAAAFDNHGHRVWHFQVPADVNADGSYTAPTDAQFGRLVSRRSLDLVYSQLNGSATDTSGVQGLGSPTVTNVFVDGRNGSSAADPTIRPALLTPTYPQVVGDIDGDGRDDYVLVGGFEVTADAAVIIPGVGAVPPPVHRLVVEAHNARNHAAWWSQTLNSPVEAFFWVLRDFDGDQWPDLGGLVFPDYAAGDDNLHTLLLDGVNGGVLISHDGWLSGVLRRGLRTPLLALASPQDDGKTAAVRVDAYGLNGWHRRITELRVAYPGNASDFAGSFTAMMDEGDLDSDGFDELGLLISTNSGSVTNHGSQLVGSNLSVHPVRLAFFGMRPGWQALFASIKGRADDLYRVHRSGRRGWRLDVDAGLRPRQLVSITLTARERPFDAYPTVLSGGYGSRCRSLLLGTDRDRAGGPLTLLRIQPSTGRLQWQRTLFGPRFPVRVAVDQRPACGAHA